MSMHTSTINQRHTKYCDAIEETLRLVGHATNAELQRILRLSYPEVSATTVHRATARLASREVIGIAPSSKDGSMRYDANITPHDHFMCTNCGVLRDTDVIAQVKPIIESSITDCTIEGRLTITGICKQCKEKRS